jgi:hypothetical protein
MKKRDLKTLALMGITGGLLLGQQGTLHAAAKGDSFQETPWEQGSLPQRKCGKHCPSVLPQHSCGKDSCSSKLSKQGCKGSNGCDGIVADNVLPQHSCGKGSCSNLSRQGCRGSNGCDGIVADRAFPQHSCGKGSCSNLSRQGCKGSNGCDGIIAEGDQPTAEDPSPAASSKKDNNPNDGNMRYHLMTEQELLLELNADGTRMYNSLDDQGKVLARKVASMMCQATNECKGLNGCMTDKNSCAGKGDCKGRGKCAISDKNLAVKLVYDKMASKRANMLNK